MLRVSFCFESFPSLSSVRPGLTLLAVAVATLRPTILVTRAVRSYVRPPFLRRRTTTLGRTLPAAATDLSHMLAVDANLFATLASCLSCLVRGELVGLALFVGGPTSLAGNFFLSFRVH